jgi:hypothetical protein
MEREHLIIIALILVAIYMMNKDDSMDSCKIHYSTMGHIRYADGPLEGSNAPNHIRYKSHEGFEAESTQLKIKVTSDNTFVTVINI